DTLFTNQHVITTNGTYVDSFTTTQGCDSLIVFVVKSAIAYSKTQSFDLCEGDTLFTNQHAITTSGTYIDSFTTAQGCDSLIVFIVKTVGYSETKSIELCEGDALFTNQHVITKTGTYIDSFTTAQGCDSLIVFVVNSAVAYLETKSVELCKGDTLFTFQHVITLAGTYIDSLSSKEKCDSLIRYEVIILDTKTTKIEMIHCEGDPFIINGEIYTQDTSFNINLLSNSGCDSIVNYKLSFKPNTKASINIELCKDDVIIINSIEIDEAGVYTDTLINGQGCDSILTIIITEKICIIDWKLSTDAVDCFGQSTGKIFIKAQSGELPIVCQIENTKAGINRVDSLLNFSDSLTFNNLPSGTYNIQLKDKNGNESNRIANIGERPKLSVMATISNFNGYGVSCHNNNDGFITLAINGGTPPYQVKWTTGAADTLLSNLYAGKYEGLISDRLNCIQNISYQLKEPDSLYLRLAITENDCVQNANLSLVNPNGGVPPYIISINGKELGGEAQEITLQPGQYNILVLDNNGCEITDNFNLENAFDCNVIIPNIIYPNSNNNNSFFSVFVSDKFNGSFQSLKIYDRWGNMVYTLDEFTPNEKLWDGTFLGKTVEQGVYTYIVEYTINTVGRKVISGDVTVVR
ncbi:MAG: hypothetical protein RLZZ546_2113, partial [Bacteroidota bacterium]